MSLFALLYEYRKKPDSFCDDGRLSPTEYRSEWDRPVDRVS